MATRFRLREDTTAPAVSPALQSYSHSAPATVRRQLVTSDSSTLTNTQYFPDGSDHSVAGDALYCQFVSAGMVAGATFTNAQTIKMAMQCLEENGNNNLFLQLFVSIVDSAGTTVQRTLRTKSVDGVELAAPGATLTNRFHTTTQDGADYTTVAGDRLVVEISVTGTPGTGAGRQSHNSTMRFGGSGAGGDLAEADGSTSTTLNPWIEFVPSNLFPIEGSFTANAVLKKEQSASFTANASIAINVSASFTADAVIPTTTIGSPTANAVVLRIQSASITADAVLKREQSASFTANAVIMPVFTADAIVLRTQTASFTADAVILSSQSASFTADAILLRTQAASSTADAVIFRTQTASSTADAFVVTGAGEGAFSADAILLKAQSAVITADAVILRAQAAVITADAVLFRSQSASVTADAVLFKLQSASFTANAVLAQTTSSSFTANAVLFRTQSASFTANAVLLKAASASLTANAVLMPSFTADAFIAGTTIFFADAVIFGATSASFTADAFIVITTRFYLHNTLAPAVSPAYASGWESTGSSLRRVMGGARRVSGGKGSNTVGETSASPTFDVAIYQFVSDPMPYDAVICGPVSGFSRVQESTGALFRSQMVVKVVSNDGSTLIGTHFDFDTSALTDEWPSASQESRRFPLAYAGIGTNGVPVTAVAGQRIVVEVGYRSHNTTTSSRVGSFRTGHAVGGVDFTTSGQTTDLNPWIDIRATARLHEPSFTADAWKVITTTRTFAANAIIDPGDPLIRNRHNRYTEHVGVDYATSQVLYGQFGTYYYHQDVESVIRDMDERITALEQGSNIRQGIIRTYAHIKKFAIPQSFTQDAVVVNRKTFSFTANAIKAFRFYMDAFIGRLITFDAVIEDGSVFFSDSIAGAPDWQISTEHRGASVDTATLTHEAGDPAIGFTVDDQSGWAKFVLTQTETVHIYMDYDPDQPFAYDPYLELFGPGLTPTSGNWRTEEYGGYETFYTLTAGTYWIGVKPYDPFDIDYYIHVEIWLSP